MLDLGLDHRLVARADVARVADLRGHALGVDAAASGYAIVLYRILLDHGVEPRECRIVPLGGSRERLAALREGRADAALLGPPHDAAAVRDGFRVLARADDHVPGYPMHVAAARASWASRHRGAVVGYCRALVAGTLLVRDAANRELAISLLAEAEGTDAAAAERRYEEEVATRPRDIPTLAEMRAAIGRVVALRRDVLGGASPSGVERYVDDSYLAAAAPELSA